MLKLTRTIPVTVLFLMAAWLLQAETPKQLGQHPAVYDSHGFLLPWTSWADAIDREMKWFQKCPSTDGYPQFVRMTFMDGDYHPIVARGRRSFIPAMQNGMGIITYLKYDTYTGGKLNWPVETARKMGDYLILASLTPDKGKYPRFTRSTGWRDHIPQPPDSGSQKDQPYEIQPDKGGIAGYALVLLWERTKDQRYLDQALHNARVLTVHMREGNAQQSPWPFRADYRTGLERGEVSGNMTFILRLYDQLIEHGYKEFATPREKLWAWIKEYQIPSAAGDGKLWVQFFEDHDELDNRTAWAPLTLARYLIERKDRLDPAWQKDARTLIEFVNRNFITVRDGVAGCGEQDYDKNPWNGVLSTYGAVLGLYSAATGSQEFRGVARQALNYVLYATDEKGCPGDGSFHNARVGWIEDAHTDKIHNFLDVLAVLPEWGR